MDGERQSLIEKQALQHSAEAYLSIQSIGPVPIGVIIGAIAGLITLMLLDNKRLPAGLVIVLGGVLTGWLFGARIDSGEGIVGWDMPEFFPFAFPGKAAFTFALLALVLPQLPMTLGNAVLAYTDLSRDYFGDRSQKVTNRKACVSMAFGNLLSFCFGGIPLCHGAGGLAAHYRFGARTGGSNLMIGLFFVISTLILGNRLMGFLNLLPMSILGVLLVFAGSQLTLTIMDLDTRKDYFVALIILGITLAANLTVGFITGMIVSHLLKWKRLSV